MSTHALHLIVGWSIALIYCFFIGMVFTAVWKYERSKCKNSDHRYCDRHAVISTASALLWPFALPALLGGLVTVGAMSIPNVKKIRHQRKMAVLEAKRKGDEAETAKTKAAIVLLEKEGIKAGVPGLFQ